MVVSQGEVWWADLPEPGGSEPGFRRPVVVVQGDSLNRSDWGTVVCVPLTGNLGWEAAPGNLRLHARATGLPKDSVAVVALITPINRFQLLERAGKLSLTQLSLLLSGIDTMLGR